MSDERTNREPEGVIAMIRRIQQGTLSGKSLSIEDRRRCVEYMTLEGYSVPEIAEVMQVTDRTIGRDRDAIRKANAVHVHPSFVEEVVGQVLSKAVSSESRLKRMSRDRNVSASDRIEAERTSWQVTKDMFGMLRSIGYLPTPAQEVRGTLTHRVEAPEAGEIESELRRLDELELDPQTRAELANLTDQVSRHAISDRIVEIQRAHDAGSDSGETADD